jgi:hypothetical protein
MRNVDLPPSFYNIDQLVSHAPSISQLHHMSLVTPIHGLSSLS